MLKKLLKYDLKWTYKVIVVFYLLGLFFAILTRIFTSIEDSILFDILGKITLGVTISMLINSLVNVILRSWARFTSNVYKDEGYLTHTLPVSKKDIYLSKVLSAITCIFSTVLVSLICLFITSYSKENLEALKTFLELAANTYDVTVINLLLTISLILFLEITFIVLCGYVGIIIGHKSNRNKMLKSIISGFGIYMIAQTSILIIMLIFALINPDIMNLIKTTENIDLNIIKTIMLFAILIYTIYNLTYYFLGKKLFEKGVDVD